MTGIHRLAITRRVFIPAAAAAGLAVLAGVVAATRVPAAAPGSQTTSTSTSISIIFGSCSGGGTEFCYKPESAKASLGSPVVWTNNSGVGHTATSCTSSDCPGAPANTGTDTFNVSIGATTGSTGSFTFTHPGTYYYYCMIHGYSAMHGKITVLQPPVIKSFSPTSGSVGTSVTITGKHLAHATAVKFNGTPATISSDSKTQIVTSVPSGATTGPISVTTAAGTATSATSFTVT
jgi:plastocyanin